MNSFIPSKGKKSKTSLEKLLTQAPQATLCELVMHLSQKRPEIQAQAYEFLHTRILLNPAERQKVADQVLLHYWKDVKKDLTKIKRSGCQTQAEENKLLRKLETLSQKVRPEVLSLNVRSNVIGEILNFLDCVTLSMLESLAQVMLAAAHTDSERITLATCLVKYTNNRYLRNIARLIYREVGDDEAYLSSRLSDLLFAEDYYDLATFYAEKDNLQKAVEIAEQGLLARAGKKQELRIFLADYVLKHIGDRDRYLKLLYENMLERFTLQSYMAFQEYCTEEEWKQYEPDILRRLKSQLIYTRFPILMHREEKAAALEAVLSEAEWGCFPEAKLLEYAQILEESFPREILGFYQRIVNDERLSTGRPAYTKKAKLTVRIRLLYLNHLNQPKQWERYRRGLKEKNLRRIAFQEEFSLWVPDWTKL